QGRGGKGSVYVWASGDGGSYDDCNCDGYASSMWTISINSAINDGRTALYDESCSSTLASTFSNGRKKDPEAGVATTDLYGNCTLRHSGTSAAAPEAAGVFALAIEANHPETAPCIARRTTTSDANRAFFVTKSRGFLGICHDFHLQKQPTTHLTAFRGEDVCCDIAGHFSRSTEQQQHLATFRSPFRTFPPLRSRSPCRCVPCVPCSAVPGQGRLVLTVDTDACEGRADHVRYLEHVQVVVTVNATRRGDLTLNLTSPMGTRSLLLGRRPRDSDSRVGFHRWPFMTTHTWGEDPRGRWTLEVGFADGAEGPAAAAAARSGVLSEWTLMLHGTHSPPYVGQVVHDSGSKLAMSRRQELEQE
uniref:Neuroendocrine convertase 2 n=1 Tax=Petromyzon marinus TaxID=7757 RepID=S4RXA2_PETMA